LHAFFIDLSAPVRIARFEKGPFPSCPPGSWDATVYEKYLKCPYWPLISRYVPLKWWIHAPFDAQTSPRGPGFIHRRLYVDADLSFGSRLLLTDPRQQRREFCF
jgi:hypothetical protein